MKLVARMLAALWLSAAIAVPVAAVSLWPAHAVADEDECGDDSEDVDPPSDEPDEPETE